MNSSRIHSMKSRFIRATLFSEQQLSDIICGYFTCIVFFSLPFMDFAHEFKIYIQHRIIHLFLFKCIFAFIKFFFLYFPNDLVR